ncbi:MAG TPA: hypothetical protein VF920_04275, partial [Dongiaceae bacterium]
MSENDASITAPAASNPASAGSVLIEAGKTRGTGLIGRAGSRPFGQKYAFVVAGVIFACLLISAGVRGSPGVLMQPLEQAFGWNRAVISAAAALGIFVYGLVGPFAAALMASMGLRRVLIGALVLMSGSIGVSLLMTEP